MNAQMLSLQTWSQQAGLLLPQTAGTISMPNGPAMRALPGIESLQVSLGELLTEPAQLVHGLIHQGTKVSLAGGSKSYKTWVLLALAVAVSLGIPWWGFPTTAGRVLYINFEVHRIFMLKRMRVLLAALSIEAPEGFAFWHLRGFACAAENIIPTIIAHIKDAGYALVVIDPTYKLMGRGDENAAGEIAHLLNLFELVAVETGAAVIFGAHFAKGSAARKEVLDRVSGSGVFARDPDTILTMTRHEEDDAFVIEPVLRNFPPVKPFVLRWEHPLMHRDDNLDPTELKRPATRNAPRKPTPTLEAFMEIFPVSFTKDPVEAVRNSAQISSEFRSRGWDPGCIKRLRDEAVNAGRLKIHRGAHNRLSMGLPSIIDDWRGGLGAMPLPAQ